MSEDFLLSPLLVHSEAVPLNIRPTEWHRRWFGKGNTPFYENFLMRKKRRMAKRMRPLIAKNMGELVQNNYPIYRVEIDLVNRCNMNCSFCAQSRDVYREPYTYMSDYLFEKIMKELGEMNYSHSLYLSCNFEPLNDPKIVQRIKLAKELVPNCYLLFFTNGLRLNPQNFHELMKYMSMMFIDNYTDGKKLIPSLKKLIPEMTPDERKRTVIYMRMQDEQLDTIAGEVVHTGKAPARKKFQTLDIGCTYPLSELQIYSNGNVHLCSKDVKQHYPMGNLGLNTIKEVWYGKKFMEARKELLSNWRNGLEICKTCDFVRRHYDETMELNQIYTQPKTLEQIVNRN